MDLWANPGEKGISPYVLYRRSFLKYIAARLCLAYRRIALQFSQTYTIFSKEVTARTQDGEKGISPHVLYRRSFIRGISAKIQDEHIPVGGSF
jgi:hypothetical protein